MTQDPGYDQRGKFSRELPVKLNAHELEIYGRTLAEKVNEKKLLEEKKKQATKEWSTKIGNVNNEITRIASARAKGEELRAVECAERLHGNVIEIVRLDTQEVVDVRPAELRDLQSEIPNLDPTESSDSDIPVVDDGEPTVPTDASDRAAADGTGVVRDDEGHRVGEAVETSTGDVAYVGEDARCSFCKEAVTDNDSRILHPRDGVMHLECAKALAIEEGDDQPEVKSTSTLRATPAEQTKAKRDRSSKSNAIKSAAKSKRKK